MPFGPFALTWRAPSPNPPPPISIPSGINRTYISTPSGPLELLSALPPPNISTSKKCLPPLLFAHGGFGCASVWLDYMAYFSKRGYACYAVSYRGHGGSWYPGFWGMYFSPRSRFGDDLVRAVGHVEGMERHRRGIGNVDSNGEEKVVLIAHSAGGALGQYVLSRELVSVRAFCMCASVPGFGSASCYKFWALTAPILFPYRLFHPRYVLVTTKDIHQAFFNSWTPLSVVQKLEKLLSPYESMLWPVQMIPSFVDPLRLLGSIKGWTKKTLLASNLTSTSSMMSPARHSDVPIETETKIHPCLLVLAASTDVLCTPSLLHSAYKRYAHAFWTAARQKRIAGVDTQDLQRETEQGSEGPWIKFAIVPGVAHHLMNEPEWERGAEEIGEWLRGL